MLPKIAIIYLSYHSDPHIDDAVAAWRRLTYPRDRLEIVIVDNPHPEHGSSVRYITEHVLPLSGVEIPHVTLLPQEKNAGYAGGNNAGMRWAIDRGFDYVYLHNDDGFMTADTLGPLVAAMENDKTIGAAQPLILLYPDTDRVNSAGNIFHYLGFGFSGEYRTKISDLRVPPISDVSYVSGAAVLFRTDLLKKFGLLDEDFFMYHEDLEYSFRLRIAGYRTVLVSSSRFYHKYQFGRSIQKFYWMERNRFGVLLMFFRMPTLIILFPMLVLLEAGLWLFALQSRMQETRIDLYRYWGNPRNWKLWMEKRKKIQALRVRRDRDLLRDASPTIQFQEKSMENPILAWIGNPIMAAYYWIVIRGLVWW